MYLSETFGLCVLLKTEGWEVHAATKHTSFCQNTDTSDAVNLHLHVRVTVRVAQVGKMRAPCGVLCVALDDHSILVKSVRQGECRLRLLPTVQVIRLFASQPVGQWSPDI